MRHKAKDREPSQVPGHVTTFGRSNSVGPMPWHLQQPKARATMNAAADNSDNPVLYDLKSGGLDALCRAVIDPLSAHRKAGGDTDAICRRSRQQTIRHGFLGAGR
jgi:hypothetical protein